MPSRELLLSIPASKPVQVIIESDYGVGLLGSTVYIRKGTVSDRDVVLSKIADNRATATATLCQCYLCDEKGKKLFEETDIPIICNLETDLFDILAEKILDVCGLRNTKKKLP